MAEESDTDDIAGKIPLELAKAQLIPPSPNRSGSAIDWLPDFVGLSWVAYGASSLLVISHFPSPLSQEETLLGPVFRQVIEPPPRRAALVKAVAWAPMLPSFGEVAAASGSDVRVYSCSIGDSNGSFCWRQIAGLVHSSTVEAMKWTESGDGILAAGIEIVWWRRKNGCWEATWKLKVDLPQTLVSTCWSVDGFSATATCYCDLQVGGLSVSLEKVGKCVSVYYNDRKSGLEKVDLVHPQPISTIQWRPSVLRTKAHDRRRDLLLTCCLDGAVRLWSETDIGRLRKHGMDMPDLKSGRSFHVVAVIEVNHLLNGSLGVDMCMVWATEIKEKGTKQCFTTEEFELDTVGSCEWLIGVGPGTTFTLWAVHCLDDTSPLRFPRVSLWKKHDLLDFRPGCSVTYNLSDKKQHSNVKAVVSRARVFGPPMLISLLQLMPDNVLCWFQLYSDKSYNTHTASADHLMKENFLTHFAGGSLSQDGHTGKILQVAVHPYSYELELAVSLDSNGLLLFWSFSSASISGEPTLFHPVWKLLGRIHAENLSESVVYTALRWVPSLFYSDPLLLLGHRGGLDFVVISIPNNYVDEVGFHKICTIPFPNYSHADGPDDIFATCASSTKEQNNTCSTFILWSMWSKSFVPWKIILHNGDLTLTINSSRYVSYVSSSSSRTYHIAADLCSSKFPHLGDTNQITSYAVVCSERLTTSLQQKTSVYQLATGFTNGSLKLWRISGMSVPNSDPVSSQLELVGTLNSHPGPVTSIAVSSCGRKIATISTQDNGNVSHLHIWESKYLVTEGRFMLEDKIILKGVVISLEWLTLGNGLLLLGVCMQEELQIFAPKRLVCQMLIKFQRPMENHVWVCVAVGHGASSIQGFQWGPRVSAILIHDTYFCLFSQWAYSDARKELVTDKANVGYESVPAEYTGVTNDYHPYNSKVPSNRDKYEFSEYDELHNIIEVVDRLSGPLPVYHPVSLLHFLSSGNCKRAYAAMDLLLKHFNSDKNPEIYQRGNVTRRLHHLAAELDLSFYAGDISTNMHEEGVRWGNDIFSAASMPGQARNTFHWEGDSLDAASEDVYITTSNSKESMFSMAVEGCLHINALNYMEKEQLLASADLLDEIKNSHHASTYDSFDEPGRRFWVAARYQQLCFIRKNGRPSAFEESAIDSGLMAWALQSDCQSHLLDSLLSSEPSWPELKTFGVGYWLTDATQLRTRMEKLARSQYLKKKDPKDCILLYLALNRLQVLSSLFKLSRDEKDKPLVGFLSRNFQEEKNKAAALKNAYVLMGKHQVELAIAFFLLGGDPSSAVTVCAKNFGDDQLALVICRLLEGYGGPLERQLISTFLLPNAVEKRDYWLASLFECILGNYSKSFWNLLDLQMGTDITMSAVPDNCTILMDPNIGQYCALLAAKNSMKNSVGDSTAALMAKWAISMTSSALKRCGLLLEALDFLSSSLSMSENELTLSEIRETDCTNWVVGDVAYHLELCGNLASSLQYISQLIKGHPRWPNTKFFLSMEYDNKQYELQLEIFKDKMQSGFSIFKKYSVEPCDIVSMIFNFSCNKGSLCLALSIVHDYISQCQPREQFQFLLPKLFMKSTIEANHLLCRYIFSCSITYSLKPSVNENKSVCLRPWIFHVQDLTFLIGTLGSLIKIYGSDFFSKSLAEKIGHALYLVQYCVYIASAWAERSMKEVTLMMRPIMDTLTDGCDIEMLDLYKLLDQFGKAFFSSASISEMVCHPAVNFKACKDERSESIMSSLPEDERWQLLGVCVWSHLSSFFTNQFNVLCQDLEEGESVPMLLKHTLAVVSSSLIKQLQSYLRQKVEKGFPVPTLVWLGKSCRLTHSLDNRRTEGIDSLEIEQEDDTLLFEKLWFVSFNSKVANEGFFKEITNNISSFYPSNSWLKVYEKVHSGCENGDSSVCNQIRRSNGTGNSENGINGKPIIFCSPKEVYMRNGELLEAMSVNSVDQKQVVVATNRKGLVFFDSNIEEPIQEKTAYIWLESEWPRNGWAGSESTPVPTYVSPGIGLGSTKKETHYGLGRAIVGKRSQVRPGRDLTGGGAFGIPGYAGIGASGFGWGENEDLDGIVDLPATVANISSKSLSSHPSRPLFLVGSNNTHIYLWEFGKEKATATYGVLPAANVPPPYSVASISALQFDQCGHRFASGALDGTVCTWQLEVGGKSDVYPTESSLCFNEHTWDVAYAAGSGSVVAAAGSSMNGVNIVIWDTLAPPTTSQASIVCHEGGARSLSVFDNDIGSGSVSPMIVSGGKGGDVGLHDFRFIATGRSKRNKHSTLFYGNNSGEKSPNGMLWYIPKAHQGSVVKIATIPNTSFFLTGGKDGNVKLWDAKNRELVFQWQRMHERHTFLQPSSRGFGGIVRAAVTDIQILPSGFITCGGDGTVKLIHMADFWCKS